MLQLVCFVSIMVTCFILISKQTETNVNVYTDCKLLMKQVRQDIPPETGKIKANDETIPKIEPVNKTLRLAEDRTVFDSPEFKRYILPRETKVNAHDYKFLLTGEDICADSKFPPILVIMCLSEYFHIEERETIRNTYGSTVRTRTWPGMAGKFNVKLVFIFGSPEDSEARNTIAQEESKKYGDIVMADFKDSYINLTRKVMMSMKWVSEYCPKAKFMLKVDEDTFVHLGNLVTYLRTVKVPDNGIIIGHGVYRSEVLRTGRWAVNMSTYPFKEYPPYSSGNTYVISGNIVQKLFNMAEHLPFVFIEDGYITGIVREAIGADHHHKVGFTWWEERAPRLCGFHNNVRISATNCDPELMTKLWNAIHAKLKNCYDPTKFVKPVFV